MRGLSQVSATLLLLIILSVYRISCNEHAKRLYIYLMEPYNKLIRPVSNSTQVLTVKVGLKLSQLIGVDEKNQVMTTNVWLTQEWYDCYLVWNPEDFGGVDHMYIPADDIWKPDITLYNNADGNFQVVLSTKATIHHTGQVVWEPPAIYKSSCTINVEFFPFDEQQCELKFSSWTYEYDQLDLKHIDQPSDISGNGINILKGIDMTDFYPSDVWDVLAIPARVNHVYYPCCDLPFPDVTFHVTIRRKTLFYTVNLIVPCMSISFLTVLVFYLPSDSGEKVTLCISILLSLTVFFLLLSELIPPTSLVVPLIGKYLLFTMIMVTISIIVTVIVLNIHYRSITTHTMSPLTRKLFLDILPRYLLLERPTQVKKKTKNRRKKWERRMTLITTENNGTADRSKVSFTDSMRISKSVDPIELENLLLEQTSPEFIRRPLKIRTIKDPGTPKDEDEQTSMAFGNIKFIAEHMRDEDVDKEVSDDWRYVAMVIDRLFLWIFTIVAVVGTMTIFLRAPTLFDDRQHVHYGTG